MSGPVDTKLIPSRTWQFTFLVLVVAAISSAPSVASDHLRWLHYITKPLATGLLLLMIIQTTPVVTRSYRLIIAIGMFFAIGGDIFLMLPHDQFLAGLVCFLLTHCAYIVALANSGRHRPRPEILILFAGVVTVVIAGLWSFLPPGMHVPVTIYAAALGLMAALAISRAVTLTRQDENWHSARRAAIGAVLFVISDILLAYGRFRWAIPLNIVFVLSLYYAAQWFFATSVRGNSHDH